MKDQGKNSEGSEAAPVQTGGFRGVFRRRRQFAVLIAIVVVAAGLLGLWGYYAMRSINPDVIEGIPYDDEALTGDYLSMNDGEIVYLLKKRTGLDANELRRHAITKGTVKNFYNGYETARAFRGLGDGNKAFEAYGAADAHVSKEDVQTLKDFYLDYARVCLELGKTAEVKKVAAKGIAVIDKSSLSASEKTDEKAELEDLIWLAQQ